MLKKQKQDQWHFLHCIKRTLVFLSTFFVLLSAEAGNPGNEKQNIDFLIDQFVNSRGNRLIVFDTQNIKQFWIDKEVVSYQDHFDVVLSSKTNQSFESLPLAIQLMNVGIDEDCKIEVISDTEDLSFGVLNNQSANIASSKLDLDFLQYHVFSSSFRLDSTEKLSFKLKFFSKGQRTVSVKKIILSFSDNKFHHVSPGTLKVDKDNVSLKSCVFNKDEESSFSVTGRNSQIISKHCIEVSDSPISSTVTVKNTGTSPVIVYFGYAPFTKFGQLIDAKNNSYKNAKKVYKVKSFEPNSNYVIVDSCPEWEKGCFAVSNAKEDLSDFPNFDFLGKVSEVVELDNKQAKIVFDKPITRSIAPETSIRLQGPAGANYLYTETKVLQPEETYTSSYAIKYNDSTPLFMSSPRVLPRGTSYVKPILLSYSQKAEDNTIQIIDFSFSF